MLLRDYKRAQNYYDYLEQFKLRKSLARITFAHNWAKIDESLKALLLSQYELLDKKILANVRFLQD